MAQIPVTEQYPLKWLPHFYCMKFIPLSELNTFTLEKKSSTLLIRLMIQRNPFESGIAKHEGALKITLTAKKKLWMLKNKDETINNAKY